MQRYRGYSIIYSVSFAIISKEALIFHVDMEYENSDNFPRLIVRFVMLKLEITFTQLKMSLSINQRSINKRIYVIPLRLIHLS